MGRHVYPSVVDDDEVLALVREPHNPHDINAIRVDSNLIVDPDCTPCTVGYVKATEASILAPMVDYARNTGLVHLVVTVLRDSDTMSWLPLRLSVSVDGACAKTHAVFDTLRRLREQVCHTGAAGGYTYHM